MATGIYLENGVYLPALNETPWGEQVNENFRILNNALTEIRIEFDEKLAGKVSLNSDDQQIINSDIIVNGTWEFRDVISGTITYSLNSEHSDNATNSENADFALKAKCDKNGDVIDTTYLKIADYVSSPDAFLINEITEHIANTDIHTNASQLDLEGYVKTSEVGNQADKIPRFNSQGHLVLPDGTEIWSS